MRKSVRSILKGVVFLLPFLIATIGFYTALHDGLFNAMDRAARLYIMELDCEYSRVTPLIEIARWTAPLMSAAAVSFGTAKSLCTRENILNEQTMFDAVRIHAGYFRSYVCPKKNECGGKACRNCDLFREDWANRSNFIRYSNVAQADHIPVKLRILLGD